MTVTCHAIIVFVVEGTDIDKATCINRDQSVAHQNSDVSLDSERSSLEQIAKEDLLSKSVGFVSERNTNAEFALWSSPANEPPFSQLTTTSTGVTRIR